MKQKNFHTQLLVSNHCVSVTIIVIKMVFNLKLNIELLSLEQK